MIPVMKVGLLTFVLLTMPQDLAPSVTSSDAERKLVEQIAESGRCADLSEAPEARVSLPRMVAPGPPPLLSFRYYEGKLHHGLDNIDLMLDDAGH